MHIADTLKGQSTQGVVQLTVQHWAFVRNPCRVVVVVNRDNPIQEVTATFGCKKDLLLWTTKTAMENLTLKCFLVAFLTSLGACCYFVDVATKTGAVKLLIQAGV